MNAAHLHPFTVHFPIALFVMVVVADFAYLFICKKNESFRKAAFYLQLFAALGAITSYFTGEVAEQILEKAGYAFGELIEQHELYAKTAMFILIISGIIRLYAEWKKIFENKKMFWSIFILNLIGLVFILIAGYLGGALVYDHLLKLGL